MAVLKYKDPVTGQYKTDIKVVGAVSSVNGETGVVNLDAEDIPYDASATHTEGSIGEQLSTHSSAITEKQDKPVSVGTAGQVLSLNQSLQPVWTDPQSGGGVDFLTVVDGKICIVYEKEDDEE